MTRASVTRNAGAGEDNHGGKEREVKITLNATETGEPIRKHFQERSSSSRLKAALNFRPRFV